MFWDWFMKPSDAAIHAKLDELKTLVIAFQAQTNERFDSVDRKLVVQNEKLDELLSRNQGLVTPELEAAVRGVSALAASIDRKVPDEG